MLYSTYQELKPDAEYTYKLLQLPPEMLETIKSSRGEIILKSTTGDDGDHLVVCSGDKTWKLRQMNHSNHVELLDNININQRLPENNVLLGFATASYEYELSAFKGLINKADIPIYNGQDVDSISIDELLNNSPISPQEFLQNWYQLGGCELNGQAIILLDEWITSILHLIMTILMSQNFDYQQQEGEIEALAQYVLAENNSYSPSMVVTILHQFATVSGNKFKLNNLAISTWFGKQALAQSSLTLWQEPQFLIAWKSNLPEFYNVSLDLVNLQGNYCRPIEDRIKYIDANLLSKDPQTRFRQLFQYAPKWDYQEFVPFILPLVSPGKKVDSLVMKYARKKKVTKTKYIVVSK